MGTKKNIIGNTYGRLIVIGDGVDGKVRCKCQCGNIVDVSRCNLTSGSTTSCGCYRKENMKRLAPQNCLKRVENYGNSGTNIGYLLKRGISKANKTGYTGVFYDSKRDMYIAKIGFQKKLYYLGSFNSLEEAVDARKAAEEEYFDPAVAEYKRNRAKKYSPLP